MVPWNKTILGPVGVSLGNCRNVMWLVILVAILSVAWGISECCLLYTCRSELDSFLSLAEEVAKLEKHLMLLRQEYVKLQKKLAETEKRCTLLAAQAKKESSNESFISRLLTIVADLYEQEQYRWVLGTGPVLGEANPFALFSGHVTSLPLLLSSSQVYFSLIKILASLQFLECKLLEAGFCLFLAYFQQSIGVMVIADRN